MIRIYSIKQALSLRGTIPELAIIRSVQFQGDGYCPLEDGHIIVLEEGDDPTHIEEIGPNGLFDDDAPAFEIVEAFVDGEQVTFEIVFHVDDSRTVAVIVDRDRLDTNLRLLLQNLSPTPQPLPDLKGTRREIL